MSYTKSSYANQRAQELHRRTQEKETNKDRISKWSDYDYNYSSIFRNMKMTNSESSNYNYNYSSIFRNLFFASVSGR